MSGSEEAAQAAAGEVVILLHGGAAGRSPWSGRRASWNEVSARLERAGLDRTNLYRKVKQLGIEAPGKEKS